MQTKIQMWGNSLALRIPKSFAAEVGLENNAAIDLALVDGKLIITPIVATAFALDALLAGITDENLHTEVDMGEAVGAEVW
ncbi:MAG: AbrB/MazE/SpoVT family DNA-binding domain-containing protein [Caldilineaceae bacterium]